jgi:hypothetical protein
MPKATAGTSLARNAAPGRATRLLAGICYAALVAVVAAPLVGREDARTAPSPAAERTTVAFDATQGFPVPIEDPLLLNEKVYQILAREEAVAPTAPAAQLAATQVAAAPAAAAPLASPSATPPAPAAPVAEARPSVPTTPASLGTAPAPEAPRTAPEAFVGVWGTHPSACAPDGGKGYLLAAIDEEGAWAGTTRCSFRDKRRTAEGWSFNARCSSPKERWTAKVRLKMDGRRLQWASQRGTQTYVRCERRLLTAQAS